MADHSPSGSVNPVGSPTVEIELRGGVRVFRPVAPENVGHFEAMTQPPVVQPAPAPAPSGTAQSATP